MEKRARQARAAQRAFAGLGDETRKSVLGNLSVLLQEREEQLITANQLDLDSPDNLDLSPQLRKRLSLTADKLETLREGITVLVEQPNPIGLPIQRRELDEGLILEQVRAPLGVLLIIFESRPDAVIQIGSLALRTGNAVIMKGGSEARHSNQALTEVLRIAAEKAGVTPDIIQNVEGRQEVSQLLQMDQHIDLVIPRGSADLVRSIQDTSRIPVLGHADGICHVYIDKSADPHRAVKITVDAKTDYAAVCNAAETLLIHREYPQAPALIESLLEAGVEVRGDMHVQKLSPRVVPAQPHDFGHEFGDLTIAARVVDDLGDAIHHIHEYGSAHTEAIVTEDPEAARAFLSSVDAASVFWNASTRFADGFRYGLGAEVGIATGRLHARGPVGMEGLLTTKWLIKGQGHAAGDYGPQGRSFTHRDNPQEGIFKNYTQPGHSLT